MAGLEYPTLFSSEEVDALLNERFSASAQVRILPDPEQLVHSISVISTTYPTIALS